MSRSQELHFTTGLPGLDAMLHGLMPGDNVVLQVADMNEYKPFVTPFYQSALAAGQRLIYFRFARHEPILPDDCGAEIHHLHPENGFEKFINETIDIIEEAGIGACYVFNCLSDLVVDWYSDRMLGNFFMLTCPFLYKLDTIAYFALLRNHHSSLATDAITNTAQVVMTIYSNKERIYVHPLKVFKRYSPTMYMLNRWNDETFTPVASSAVTAEILSETPQPWLNFTIHRPGLWTEAFIQAKEVLDAIQAGRDLPVPVESIYNRLLRMAITRDEEFIDLAERYFSLEFLIQVLQRMIGTGLIGGKTLGMLLAREILKKDNPEWEDKLEPHDSFFIGSDVFYTYLVVNDCWWLRREQRICDTATMLEHARQVKERIYAGRFPEDIQHQFMDMLNYFGQSPIIVRSSSLLEDNYGNAFSGKYESVFCANQGTPEKRLEDFMAAVRTVYASTMNIDALTYREQRGLLDRDEQMALLVQRVSGSTCDKLFFPQLAGVGFSFNPYVWNSDIDPKAGMLRLVFGLGTRAVDRIEEDYTRLVALNAPLKRPEANSDEKRRFSQRYADVLDLEANELMTHEVNHALASIPETARSKLASRDYELEKYAREHGRRDLFTWRLDFDRVFKNTPFIHDMHKMLASLQAAYNHPVDVEFTCNFTDKENYLINLVQCRPFQVKVTIDGSLATVPESVTSEHILLESCGPILGQGLATIIDRLVYIVPSEYAKMSTQQRYSVARVVGHATHLAADHGLESQPTIMLIGPGRWGTRSPSLGVPVSFTEINTSSIMCEIAVMHEGLVPDVSLGTHFFNDLVEMDMIYMAVFPEKVGNRFNQQLLEQAPNRLRQLVPDAAEWEKVVRVIDSTDLTPGHRIYLRSDPVNQHAVVYIAKPPREEDQ